MLTGQASQTLLTTSIMRARHQLFNSHGGTGGFNMLHRSLGEQLDSQVFYQDDSRPKKVKGRHPARHP